MATWGVSNNWGLSAVSTEESSFPGNNVGTPDPGYQEEGPDPSGIDQELSTEQYPYLYWPDTDMADWTYADGVWTYKADSGGSGEDGGDGSGDAMFGDLEDIFQPDLFSSSSSYEGLPEEYRDQINESIIPAVIESALGLSGEIDTFEDKSLTGITSGYEAAESDYKGNISDALAEIDEYTRLASRNYELQAQEALSGSMTDILNSLANKNVLNSSIASDTIAKAAAEIIVTYTEKGYDAAIQAAEWRYGLNAQEAETLVDLAVSQTNAEQGVRSEAMGYRAGVPATLAAVGSLGRYSESESSDPLQPYELLANFIMGY